MVTLFTSMLGLTPTTTRLATPGLSPAADISRRGFLATLGGLAATAMVGCGSSETTHDAGRPDSGLRLDAGADAGPPSHFSLDTRQFATLPCEFTPDFDVYASRILGVCTATMGGPVTDHNDLYDVDPSSSARPIPYATDLDIPIVDGIFMNQFTATTGNRGVITTNTGLYEVFLGSPATQRFIPFPSGSSYGGGAVYAGNKLFVPVANLASATMYNPGQVLVYNVSASGVIQDTPHNAIPTSRLNPTGIVARNASTLVVLNSGDFGTSPQASIDLIDVDSETILRTITLGSLTAQVSGEIALSPDGNTVVIGTAAYSAASAFAGRVLFIHLDSAVANIQNIPGTLFHSSVKIDPALGIVYVTDFNAGTVTILNLATQAIIDSVNLMATGAGPSEIVDGALIQAIANAAVRVYPG